MKSTKLEQ